MRLAPLALAVCLPFALSAKKPFSVDVQWDYRTATDAQVSPDGRSVVWVTGWSDRMNDAMYSSLWIAPSNGREQRALTEVGPHRDGSPRWSPDGTRIAFLSNRSGKQQIHILWTDTGRDTRITDLQQSPSALAWSPDGRWIAYTARVPAKTEWDIKLDKPTGAKWAEPPIVVNRLKWRADAGGILQPGFTHIFVVSSAGGAPRQISTGDFDHSGPLSWSPDGQWILASAQREKDADYSLAGGEIYAFSVADGSVRQLTKRVGPDTEPVMSPDGKKIAYLGNDYKHQSYSVTHLYVMDADGAHPKLLTRTLDRDVRHPVWSEDSKYILFAAEDQGVSHLYRTSQDGNIVQITRGRTRIGGYANPEVFSMAHGVVALVRSGPDAPPDVYTFRVNNASEAVRLSSVNSGLMADRDLAGLEEIHYKSFDGRDIQAWLLKPPHFDGLRKYPLILDIHGGPHQMYGIEFNPQMQNYAARGYVVLYGNPRGSTGYGEEFGNVIHGNYPGDDYKDLMAGVDHVIAKGYIDEKRMGVTGGSGGGLLTAWIVGHTDRFAAAVSQYPVTNWITQAGTADIGLLMTEWMKATPWDNPQQYLAKSPVFFASHFKTPTMVITGESDYRTPIAQSEEFYFALKMRKVPSLMVRIPDEPHGIRGAHPSHRVAKIEYILGWMDKYLDPVK